MAEPMTVEELERLESPNPCDGGCRAWECADEIRRLRKHMVELEKFRVAHNKLDQENNQFRECVKELEGDKAMEEGINTSLRRKNAKLRTVVDGALSCWPDAEHNPTPEQIAAFFKALRELDEEEK